VDDKQTEAAKRLVASEQQEGDAIVAIKAARVAHREAVEKLDTYDELDDARVTHGRKAEELPSWKRLTLARDAHLAKVRLLPTLADLRDARQRYAAIIEAKRKALAACVQLELGL